MRTKKKKKRRVNKRRLGFILYFLVLLILLVVVYGYPKLSGAMERTTTIEYGELKVSDTLTCYIIRDEIVYFANENGKVDYSFEEGELVPSGAEIAEIHGDRRSDSQNYDSYNVIVNRFLDGYTLLDPASDQRDTVVSGLRDRIRDLIPEDEDEDETASDLDEDKDSEKKQEKEKNDGESDPKKQTDADLKDLKTGNQINKNGTTIYASSTKKVLKYRLDRVQSLGDGKGGDADEEASGKLLDFGLSGKDDDGNTSSKNLNQTGIDSSYKTDYPGRVSYILDGYESELNPDTMLMLNKEKLQETAFKYKNLGNGNATKGEPLFKLVRNDAWYAVSWITDKQLNRFDEGKNITLKLPNGDMKGTISKIVKEKNASMVIMSFDQYCEGLSQMRKVSAEVVTSDYSGLRIKNSFITTEDKILGVYVVNLSGEAVFTPIKVKATDGEYSLLAAGTYNDSKGNQVKTVNVYDEIRMKSGSRNSDR